MGGGELVNVCLGVLAEKLLEEFVFVVGRGGGAKKLSEIFV